MLHAKVADGVHGSRMPTRIVGRSSATGV